MRSLRQMSDLLGHSRVYLVLLNEVRAEVLAEREFTSYAAVLKDQPQEKYPARR